MIKSLFKILALPFVKLYRWLMYMEAKSILKQRAKDIFKNEDSKRKFINEFNRAAREKTTGKRYKKPKKRY